MNEANRDRWDLRQQSLAFFGKVSASFSHEINNAVSILAEYSGLLGDLIYMADQGRPLNLDKLKNINEKMKRQVKEGEASIKRFNKFSHSADQPVMTFDLSDLCENLVALSQRLASRKGITVELVADEKPVELRSSPFLVQQFVFYCIELVLANPGSGNRLTITVEPSGQGGKITIPIGELLLTEGKRFPMETLLSELDGRMEVNKEPDGAGEVVIFLPNLRLVDPDG